MREPCCRCLQFFLLTISLVFALPAWAALPTLSINDVTLDESTCEGPSFVFTVTLSYLGQQPVAVNYATSDGSPSGSGIAAVGGKDYVPVSGVLTFTHAMKPNGPRGSYLRTITVPLGNYVVSAGANDGRQFTLALSGATNATISRPQGTGTLTNAALSCTPAQNATCYVNFCGAATSCKNVNRSATATPYCQLVLGGGQCVGTVYRDSDGDGLSDAAEAQGYIDVNANGVYDPGIDIPLPGADPDKPDLYLHYDYTSAADHNHNPPAQAIQWIVDAFAAHGINLHIDPQHNAICENAGDAGCITAGTGGHVVSLTEVGGSCTSDQQCANSGVGAICSGGQCILNPSCVGSSAVSPGDLRTTVPYLNLIKPAYHYMIFGHYFGCPGDNAALCANCPTLPEDPACGASPASKPSGENLGEAEVLGDDSVVTTQPFVDTGIPLSSIRLESWAGIAMHEFGHNLGLLHGGADCFNFKPNYVSMMSYMFYGRGIPTGASPGDTVPQTCTTDADCNAGDHAVPAHCSLTTNTCFRIDYSDRQFNTLDENNLDESVGLQGGANNTDISGWRGFPGFENAATNGAAVDWNRDGTIETGIVANIDPGFADFGLLASQNDWATTPINGVNNFTNLNFSYQCSPNFDDDLIIPHELRFGKKEPMVASARPTFEQWFLRYWRQAARMQPAQSGVSNTIPRPVRDPGKSSSSHSKVDFLPQHRLFE